MRHQVVECQLQGAAFVGLDGVARSHARALGHGHLATRKALELVVERLRVRSDDQRRLLFDLDMNLLKLRAQLGETAETIALTGVYHNLLRQWAST